MVGGKHSWLVLSVFFGSLSYLYSRNTRASTRRSFTVEHHVIESLEKVIVTPVSPFKKVLLGMNCNVDVIVSGTALLSHMNISSSDSPGDHAHMEDERQFEQTFAHFLTEGAPAERYLSSPDAWSKAVIVANEYVDKQVVLGGNAAIMANHIASLFPSKTALLVGPIGPVSRALLHPRVITSNSTRIAKDEVHIIMAYKQGEIWGDGVAMRTSRFIVNHDLLSGSTLVMDMLFNAIAQHRPDILLLNGIHLLEHQPKELWHEKLRMIRRNLKNVPSMPIHIQVGSIGQKEFAMAYMKSILPLVDSVGLNEQELAFLSMIGGGPYAAEYPVRGGAIHVHKAVDIIYWLLSTFGADMGGTDHGKTSHRLQRVHFTCLTYHVTAAMGSDWSNLGSSLAAGALEMTKQQCGQEIIDPHSVELRIAYSFVLDKEVGKVYTFNAESPMKSWMRNEVVFVFTPVLVCKQPVAHVGVDDRVAATSLMYSQFYRFGITS